MYTLVVVDMQPEFIAARDKKVQLHCKRAIAKAIKQRASIVFVEFVDHGDTLPCLTKLTRGYDKVYHVSKDEWDGSQQSLAVIRQNKLSGKRFVVCGVYTDCCVNATVGGLVRSVPDSRIKVLRNACGATDERMHADGLRTMNRHRNVRLVK
jgi:nicotinamidase-related amidase